MHTAKYGSKESDNCECAFAKCVKYEKQCFWVCKYFVIIETLYSQNNCFVLT